MSAGGSNSDAQRPVVLIHGFLGGPSDWDPFQSALRREAGAAAFPCVTVDLLDVARRIKSASTSTCAIGLPELAARIWADLEADARTQDGFDLVGYSMGGRIALDMAVQRGDAESFSRSDSPMFVFVSAHPGLDDSNERAVRAASDDRCADRLALLNAAKDPGVRRELASAFLDEWYGQALFSTLRVRDDFVNLVERRRNDLAHADSGLLWAAIVSGCSPGRSSSQWDALARKTHNCSMIVGGRDARYVAVANRARSSGMCAAVIADAGHAVHLEQPAQLAAHLIQLRLDRVRCSLREAPTR